MQSARERHGVTANGIADRRTLLRRAAFALTGLPPEPADLERWLADPRPDALQHAVEELLASPHYGERQARHWLDLARYSDSNGLDENLAFAQAFRYRDWVVAAHNQDLPFDRFGAMQIAGDLMVDEPGVGVDGHVATGFLALGPRMLAEQDKEKLVLDTVDEQVDLVGRTFLGLTLGCARCHDHKFDPISQRDYYALAGVFRSTKAFHDLEHVSKWFDRELASDDAIAARKAAENARDDAARALREAEAAAVAAQRAGLVADAGRYLLAGAARSAATVHLQAESCTDTSLRADAEVWGSARCVVLHTHRSGPQYASWTFDVPASTQWRLDVRYAAKESRPMRVSVDGREVATGALAATTGGWLPAQQEWHEAARFPLAAGRHELRLEAVGAHVPHLDALLLSPAEPTADAGADLLPPIVHQVALAFATRGDEPLLALCRTLLSAPADGFATAAAAAQGKGGAHALVLGGLPPESPRELAARCQTLFETVVAATPPASAKGEPARLADPTLEQVRSLLFERDGLFAAGAAVLRAHLPATTAARLHDLEQELAARRAAVPAAAPLAMCVAEGAVRDLPVHLRGNHLTLAPDAVPRGVPAVLAALVPGRRMPGDRSGRRELAAWLFDPGQALVPRVLVNRIWQRAFGHGLCRSPSNFGVRGDVPLHRDLLDWLARDFVAHGWSQKHVWRRILSSRTWQLASDLGTDAAAKDPDNRLLWRQQRTRLEAEAVRDAMLAVAGSLDRTLGGSLLGTADRGYVTNDQSQDAASYDAPRRSLYLPVIRNAMYDLFAAFDYADPSVHLEQRPASAVATQALLVLNAPFVHQAARGFAERTRGGARDDDERITLAFRLAFGRAPADAERQAARRWLATAAARGAADQAWPGLCHALLASNEFLYVD